MHCVKVFSLMVCIFVLDVASWSQKIAKKNLRAALQVSAVCEIPNSYSFYKCSVFPLEILSIATLTSFKSTTTICNHKCCVLTLFHVYLDRFSVSSFG